MKITKKQEQLLSYILIAIICISLVNFAMTVSQKKKQAKIDHVKSLLTKEKSDNTNLRNELDFLDSKNTDIQNETNNINVSHDGSGEFGEVEYIYEDNYLTDFRDNMKNLNNDNSLYTALPLEDQLYNVIYTRDSDTSLNSILTAEAKGFGPGYTYTISDRTTQNIATIKKTNDLNETYDIFLFGPFGLVLDYNTKTNLLNHSVEIGRREMQHTGLGSLEFNLSYLKSLGELEDNED